MIKKNLHGLLIATLFITIIFSSVNFGNMELKKDMYIKQDTLAIFKDIDIKCNDSNGEELLKTKDSSPKTYISKSSGNCAVIIGQSGAESGGECIYSTTNYVRDIFRNHSYNVLFMDAPSIFYLENRMINFIKNNIGGEKKLFFYYIGHGKVEELTGNGFVKLTSREKLYDYKFAEILDKVSSYYSNCTVVMESCYVGSFIDDISGPNRIIITSTDAISPSNSNSQGGVSPFAEKFFDEYSKGKNLAEAWMFADDFFSDFYDQNPQIDDNGNGVSVGRSSIADKLPMKDSLGEKEGNLAFEWQDGEGESSKSYSCFDFKNLLTNLDEDTSLSDMLKNFVKKISVIKSFKHNDFSNNFYKIF